MVHVFDFVVDYWVSELIMHYLSVLVDHFVFVYEHQTLVIYNEVDDVVLNHIRIVTFRLDIQVVLIVHEVEVGFVELAEVDG